MTRIGILTSGGDCPGLNAVISAVVKCASRKNWEVYGIPFATEGFMQLARGENKPEDFRLRDHGYDIPGFLKGLDVLQFLSGSILGSLSSGKPVMEDIIKGYQILGLNALIAVGGDGSLDIIYNIAKKGNWNLVAIPKTIDNDVPYTEQSVGFDTAVNTVTKAIYDLAFTAASHERVMIVEVMGRDAGHLALHSGIAGGADIILIPELTPQLNESIVDKCCHKIAEIRSNNGRKFALIVIAEGVRNHERQRIKYIGDYLGSWIKSHSKELCGSGNQSFCDFDALDTRVTVLGHLQRTGTPSSFDRILATAFGIKAVNLIEEEKYYQLVVWRNGKVESESLDEVLPILRNVRAEKGCSYPVDPHGSMIETAKSLGIYVGND